MTQVATTGKVTTSIENVSVDRILHSIDVMSRPKTKKEEPLVSSDQNGIMSFKEILDLGFGPCEVHTWITAWPTLGGQESVRESVARRCEDLEIC